MTTVNSRTIEKQVEDFLDDSFNTEDYFNNSETQKRGLFYFQSSLQICLNVKIQQCASIISQI